ncbi:MAG: 7-carboxy-7-deazaguanine synthase QueE [Planctomycetota bacterium]|nr:7-carboxy-7-deazaguanine synthase QueE [Planctomycetota bacterium]
MTTREESETDTKGYVNSTFISVQGEGAQVGQLHLFVRMSRCNLRCEFCDTPEALNTNDKAMLFVDDKVRTVPNPMTAGELADVCKHMMEETTVTGITVTGGEPLVQPLFISRFLDLLGEDRPPAVLETNSTLVQSLETVLDRFEAVSADFKLAETGVPGYDEAVALRFIELAAASTETWVKVPFDENVTEERILDVVGRLKEVAPDSPVILQPIVTVGSRSELSGKAMLNMLVVASRVGTDVRLIPQIHKFIQVQ